MYKSCDKSETESPVSPNVKFHLKRVSFLFDAKNSSSSEMFAPKNFEHSYFLCCVITIVPSKMVMVAASAAAAATTTKQKTETNFQQRTRKN